MRKELLIEEIKTLNRQYLLLCLRLSEVDEFDACISLNAPLTFIRALKTLSLDQILQIAETAVCIVKPSINDQTVLQLPKITDITARSMYLHSASSNSES